MVQLEVLVVELVAVDGLAPGTVLIREVTALAHAARVQSAEVLSNRGAVTRAALLRVLTSSE